MSAVLRKMLCRMGVVECDEQLHLQRRDAGVHVVDAAARVRRGAEDPHVRLIVQSADDLREVFGKG